MLGYEKYKNLSIGFEEFKNLFSFSNSGPLIWEVRKDSEKEELSILETEFHLIRQIFGRTVTV